ncbi:MAG: hypothetical protein KGJ34_01270 [Patescibacteria group bacterium]|nr:hypothetical protein [Patescibacteria group bacterium]
MKKYFVVYRVPTASMDNWMKTTDPKTRKEQMDKLMSDMAQWTKKHSASLTEQGAPLGKTKSVTSNGITDTRNDLNYYTIVEASSHEEAAKLFADNPHLQIPTSSIDVMDIPHMGM